VLFSFVKGEQLEYPIELSFLSDVRNYNYEAVLIEADNVDKQTDAPSTYKPDAVKTKLVVRVPVHRGPWDATANYSRDEVVSLDNVYYVRLTGNAVVDAIAPNVSPEWAPTARTYVWIQFLSTLGSDWKMMPTISTNTYGFFELRVTELGGSFPKTWKPVRGMLSLLFSPTDIVPDA